MTIKVSQGRKCRLNSNIRLCIPEILYWLMLGNTKRHLLTITVVQSGKRVNIIQGFATALAVAINSIWPWQPAASLTCSNTASRYMCVCVCVGYFVARDPIGYSQASTLQDVVSSLPLWLGCQPFQMTGGSFYPCISLSDTTHARCQEFQKRLVCR